LKIAIHNSKHSFSERWIRYCEEKNYEFKIVNCYSNDLISLLEDCDYLLWHHNHADPRDVIIAKQIISSVESKGIKVFPNTKTTWHFDDKLGQKYLFEALKIPTVKTYAFYSKNEAVKWINNTQFPKVFKLRRGAGSRNVKLIKSRNHAHKLVNRCFGSGFRQYDAIGGIKEQIRKLKFGKTNIKEILKAFAHIYYPLNLEKSLGKERGYAYFQDFIPKNDFDIRVVVIGDKAFAIKRFVRKGDFRASGSGFIDYDKTNFNDTLIQKSFDISDKLNTQCAALDFVFDDNNPLLVEISFGFKKEGYDPCPGYWDKELHWIEGKFNPYGWMIENLLNE